MAYYRASKVIKMRRNALGHSREEYSAEGPSDRTIYRMEKGKVHIKESTYRRLTRVMDEEESTRQGILQTKDMGVLWLTNKITGCLYMGDYEMAEELVQQIETRLDVFELNNQRYLDYIKAYLKYCKSPFAYEEYKCAIETSLSHGNRNYEELIKNKWPFSERECNRIVGLVELVRKEKAYERQKELLEQLLELLESKYMDSEYNTIYQIVARYRMGDVLGNLGFHREAIVLDEETITMCEERQDWRFFSQLNYDIFWNYMMLNKKETLTQQEETRRKECLLRAYYMGKAMAPDKSLYKRRVLENYPDEL